MFFILYIVNMYNKYIYIYIYMYIQTNIYIYIYIYIYNAIINILKKKLF